MCGIFGQISACDLPIRESLVQRAQGHLLHRGPDDRGLCSMRVGKFNAVVGHTRLAIIDLSQAGHQPMISPDGKLVLSYNGELYNYKECRQQLEALGHIFRSGTDTEVILTAWAQWGSDCIDRFNGMFAFAILDLHQAKLHLVRDEFGIKPLFFHQSDRQFTFASEIQAVRDLNPNLKSVNLQRAYSYLVQSRYDHGDETFIDGVYRLRPGTILSVDLGQQRLASQEWRWYFPSIEEDGSKSLEANAETLRELLLTQVSSHLQSDVPLAVALSGGLDSASLVALTSQVTNGAPVHTFSYMDYDSGQTDRPWIDRVNDAFPTIPHPVVIGNRELARDIDALLLAQGEPFGDTTIYAQFRVYQHIKESGFKVVLDGQGADEVFAGYAGFPEQVIKSLVDKRQFHLIPGFAYHYGRWPDRTTKSLIRSLALDTKLAKLLTPQDTRRPTYITQKFELQDPVGLGHQAHGRRLVELLRFLQAEGGMASLLRQNDRSSMHWSVESRVPFLTKSTSEFALRLPECQLVSPRGETKVVLRRAMRDLLPRDLVTRRDKIGFGTPGELWLRGIGDELLTYVDGLQRIPFVDTALARSYVRDAIANQSPFDWRQVWRLVNLGRWCDLVL